MEPIEIITIVLIIFFFIILIGSYIYKKKHHLPTGECGCCSKAKRQSNLVALYHKKYKCQK